MSAEWEYKVRQNPYPSSTDELTGYLDEYGRNGWELCGIAGTGWLIFKREKAERKSGHYYCATCNADLGYDYREHKCPAKEKCA